MVEEVRDGGGGGGAGGGGSGAAYHLRLLVRLHRQLGLLGTDVQRLRLRELAALDADLRLRGEHLRDRRRVVRLGDPRRVRPVVLVRVPE